MTDPAKYTVQNDDQGLAVYNEMLAVVVDMRLSRGTYAKLCEKYGISDSTVRRIWRKRYDGSNPEEVVEAIISKPCGNVGRSRVDEDDMNKRLENSPLRCRRTFKHASLGTGYSATTIWRVLYRGGICGETNTLKPV